MATAVEQCQHTQLLLLLVLAFLLLTHRPALAMRKICEVTLKDESSSNERIGRIVNVNNLRAEFPQLGEKNIKYRLLSDNKVSDYFRLDDRTGVLFVRRKLDRDNLCEESGVCCKPRACQFKLEVAATCDGLAAPAFIKCIVHVEDANDNPPKFKSKVQTITIKESTPVGNSIRLETANDLDSRRNSVQKYNTLEPLPEPFSLEKIRSGSRVTGLMLRLEQKLNREQKDRYKFVLRAIDGGSPPLTGSMTVSIIVDDDNDNAPKFVNSSYKVHVNEGKISHSPILTLHAKDADIGENAKTIYGFEGSVPSSIKQYFRINPSTGSINLIRPLDYEKQSSYRFKVTATDALGHLPSAVAEVRVIVDDLNDEYPVVTIKYVVGDASSSVSQPKAFLTENAMAGQLVAYISVKDRDTGINGIVNCSLRKTEGSSAFRLEDKGKSDSTSAYHIKTMHPVDREKISQVDLVIDCWDKGRNRHHVKTKLPVFIMDVNDNTPNITLVGKPSVEENKPKGTRVVHVRGFDPDHGANGTMIYSMEQSLEDVKQLFRIDRSTGWITTKMEIDREKIDPPLNRLPVIVTVRDKGRPPRTGTRSFDITIVDVNDNAPKFLEDPILGYVEENSPKHTQVCEIHVTDRDSVGRLQVTIDKQFRQVPFIIHSIGNKFFLNTTKMLDRERQQSYSFNIVAYDEATSVTAKAIIEVKNLNDNDPQIIFPSTQNKTFNLSWRESKGFQLMRINVKDPDDMDDDTIQHFFELHADNDILHVDPTSGAVVVQRPIRETEVGYYPITVEVKDGDSPYRTSRVHFILHVDRSKPNYISRDERGHATPTDSAHRNMEGDIILIVVLVFVLILLVVIIVLLIYVRHWKQSSFDFLPDLFGFCCPYQNRKRANNSRTPRQRQPEVENDKLTAAAQNCAVERKLSNLAQDAAAVGGSSSDFYVTNGYEFHPGHPNFGKTAVKYQTIGSSEEAEALRAAALGHEYHEIDQRTTTVRDPDGRYYDVLVNGPHAATLGRNPHLYQTLYPGDTTRRHDKRSKTLGGGTPDASDFATSPKQRRDGTGGKSNVPASRSDSNVNSNLQRVCMPDMGSTQTASETSGEGFSPKHKTFSSYSMAMRGASPGEQVYTRSYPHVEASFV